MKNMFEAFEKLAREWADFNKAHGGGDIYNSYGGFVGCCGSKGLEAVTFGTGVGDECKIVVTLYARVQFSDITYATLANWEVMVASGRAELEAHKMGYGLKTAEMKRIAEVRHLRKRLAELGEV